MREIALLNKDCAPIASLCLVAGECIGELDLQGVVVLVLFYHLPDCSFVGRVLTVMIVETVVERALFIFGERGLIVKECVQDDCEFYLVLFG